MKQTTLDILRHLASRPGHDEVKADFRQLLVEEFGADINELDFERRVPEVRGRLDALIGRTVFEAKSNLSRELRDVRRRLPDYLKERERAEGEKFVGIASDGLEWMAFELEGDELVEIGRKVLDPDDSERFLAWLDSVLALKSSLPPDALTIKAELGQDSVAYRRARTKLEELWRQLKDDPTAMLKQQLWASLLKLVYGRDAQNDELWLQHTYLVITAKTIATAVVGLHEEDPERLLSGEAFSASGISGAVESDFFDWVLQSPAGHELVRRIFNHVRRFRLREVETDVLKVLYESLIDRDERHGLGEYYTPDWLASKIIRRIVDSPAEQKVLDPACGSGTFLFHAVRACLADAEDAGVAPGELAAHACAHVAGMDIHPVAVIIARVTYLLALAPVLARRAGGISIPVYLGDSLQLSIRGGDMIEDKELIIEVPPPPAGMGHGGETDAQGREILAFPDTFCRDMALFDKAIEQMRQATENGWNRSQVEQALKRIVEQHYKRDINEEETRAITDMGATYMVFDRLRRVGRDTVWAYVARNLSRPLALSAAGGWANVLVGNPPWVAYRHMSKGLQKIFKAIARGENVYVGGKLATQNDLAALFVVRATALYLRPAGRLAFVMPLAALSRGQYEKFRRGSFTSTRLQFTEAWTMDSCLQPLFPVPSCVVFGRKRATARATPDRVTAFCGQLPMRDAPEALADEHLQATPDAPTPEPTEFEGGSPYRKHFRQGATLVPRKLCLVERVAGEGILGTDAARPRVKSWLSPQEKQPWKAVPALEANVEEQFLRPVLLGESILPWRIFRPFEGVIPVDPQDHAVLDAESAANRGFAGLNEWMRKAEALWMSHRSESTQLSLTEQLDYYGKLSSQFPIPSLRVVYAKAGQWPASCLVRDTRTVLDHMLYWYEPQSEDEGYYLVALLNSEEVRQRIAHMQSRGQWGARHFDKVFFNLNIPRFDADNATMRRITSLAREAEALTAQLEIPADTGFQRARRMVRDALHEQGVSLRLDALVARLLDSRP